MPSFPSVIDLTTFVADGYGFIIQGDTTLDRAGWSVSAAGDINGDGIGDVVVGAPYGQDSSSRPGEVYVIFGTGGSTRGNIDLSSLSAGDGFIIQGDAAGDALGRSVSGAGDVNGDGYDDLVVGAGRGDDGGDRAGEAYVIFGKAGATRDSIDLSALSPNDGFIIQGDAAIDVAGDSVSNAGDMNGDGIDDLIIGAQLGDDGGTDAGEAYVIFGVSGATRSNIDLTTLSPGDGFIIQGDAAGDEAGRSVSAAGDVNGDGIDDVIVGAPRADAGGFGAGAAYVIFGTTGPMRPNIDLTTLAQTDGFVIVGDIDGNQAGFSVSEAGDVNDDGIDDIVVGAYLGSDGGTYAGEAYVIFGKAGSSRPNIDLTSLAATDGFIIQGDRLGDQTARSVSSAGDINGDGIDDLIVGAPGGDNGGNSAGEAYVIFGKAGATRTKIDLTFLAASDGLIIQGDAANDYAGYSVSSAGDINGDGVDDLIVGARGGDDGGTYAGEAYVIFGIADAPAPTTGDDNLAGTPGDDTIDLLDGNDTYDAGAGTDHVVGGGGSDVFIVGAGETAAGEVYDGGIDTDTISIVDGDAVDFTGVTITDVEAIVSDANDTTLTVDNEAIARLVTNMAGTADVVHVNAWTAYGIGALLDLLTGRGIEQVMWTGDVNAYSATINGALLDLVATDNSPGGAGRPYQTIVNSFETDGDLRKQVRADDDGAVSTTNYDADGVITDLIVAASAAVPARSYTSLVNTYAGGLLDLSVLTATNGVTTTRDYDTSGPSSVLLESIRDDANDMFVWQTITETYGAGGALTRRLTLNDDGGSTEMNYAGGVLADRLITFADGRTSETTFAGSSVVLTRNTAVNGDQTVIGGAGDDTITGGTGNDLLRGGGGDDLFLFSGSIGNDRIADFDANPGDRLDLTAYNIDALADIAGNGFTASQVGRNTVIDLGANGTITLMNFQIANLDDGDFVFE